MKTKIYFHYEPTNGNATTIPVTVDEDMMLEGSLQLFIQISQSANSFFSSIVPRHCIVKLENGKSLSLTSKKTLLDLIGEETDLFITIDQKLVEEDKLANKPPSTPTPVPFGPQPKPSNAISDNFEQSISLFKEFMTKRLYKRGKLLFEKILLSIDIPPFLPTNLPTSNTTTINNTNNQQVFHYQLHIVYIYQCLMEIHYHAKRYHETIKIGLQFIHMLLKDTSQSSTSTSSSTTNGSANTTPLTPLTRVQLKKFLFLFKQFQYFELCYLLAKAYFELKKYDRTIEIITVCIEQYQSIILNLSSLTSSTSSSSTTAGLTSSTSSSTTQTPSSPPPPPPPPPLPATTNKSGSKSTASPTPAATAAASSTSSSASSSTNQQTKQSHPLTKLKHQKHKIHFYLNMISLQAETTYLNGEHLQAANILNTVMDIPLGDSNLLILKTYILFTFQYFKYHETMSAVLKTIAIIGTESKKLSTSLSSGNSTSSAGNANGNNNNSSFVLLNSPSTSNALGGIYTSHIVANNSHHYIHNNQSITVTYNNNNTTTTTITSIASDEKGMSKRRQDQKPSNDHKKQREENYTNQTDSDDDELDVNQQIYDYEYPSQMKIIKQLIIKFLLTKEGYEQLIKRLPPNSRGTAEIYAYLATIAKEFSAIELAIKFYEIALQIQSNSINYTLNLIHIYELSYDYHICLEMIQIFCAKNLNLSIGKDRNNNNTNNNSNNNSNNGSFTMSVSGSVLLPLSYPAVPSLAAVSSSTSSYSPCAVKYIFSCADVIDLIKQNSLIQSSYCNTSGGNKSKKNKNNNKTLDENNIDGVSNQEEVIKNKEKYLYYKVVWHLHSNNTPTSPSQQQQQQFYHVGSGGFASVERYVFIKEEEEVAGGEGVEGSVSKSLNSVKIPKITFIKESDDDDNRYTPTTPPTLPSSTAITKTTPTTTSTNSPSTTNFPYSSINYFDREYDLIALIATMIKIYYLQGHLYMIPIFIERLEVIRLLSLQPLHYTYIRNELAYYQDIVQILVHRSQYGWYGLQYLKEGEEVVEEGVASEKVVKGNDVGSVVIPDRLVMEYAFINLWQPSSHSLLNSAREKSIYICGDSHCLSLAWNIVKKTSTMTTTKKKTNTLDKPSYHLLVPKLVTGVIMLIGEIDCREGFLVALERDYYDSIEDAMNTTIKAFLHNLQQIRETRQLKIYIHPIPPVLNETRKIVMLFNVLYKQQIEELKDPNILWLDFLYDLVDRVTPTASSATSTTTDSSNNGHQKSVQEILSEEYSLKEIYQHDGTHLHPRYVTLVEKAINKHIK
eukprot:gene3155-3363_t